MKRRRIYITELDMKRLEELLHASDLFHHRERKHLLELEKELKRAKVVPSEDIPADIVTMNSRVRIKDMDSGEDEEYTLVYPGDADVAQKKISVLAPVGIALIGYSVGDTIVWEVPGGLRKLKLLEILYQPEGVGDYHL